MTVSVQLLSGVRDCGAALGVDLFRASAAVNVVCPHFRPEAKHRRSAVRDNEEDLPPQRRLRHRSLCSPRRSTDNRLPPPAGSHKEPVATLCDAKQRRHVYASSSPENRESAEEGEDEEDEEEEEEGREEEEEQRPLCSGVLGYPVVRDHSLVVGLSSTAEAPAANAQSQNYKGERR